MKKVLNKLFKKLSLLIISILMVSAVWAQNSIKGTVVDGDGLGMPGVAVVVEGTTIGTVTDLDGNYTLTVSDDATSLLFSFIGMKTVVEAINGRTIIDVTMEADAIGLEEVIAVGYGIQKRATLTGAIGSVKAEEMLQRPVANTTELLQGQVAGLVTRQKSGLPGDDGTILRIRGFDKAPLVLIDGIEGSLAQVDPNDIESVSVLKDASAAVYGARAGNGVVLVTTKRGTQKPSQISYRGTVSFTQPTFLPDQVNAREWAEMLYESGLNPDDYSPNHVKYNPDNKTLTNTVDNSDYTGYDWGEALYRNWTPQHQHNVSARGGTEKIKYFVSAGFTDQESTFKSGDYDFNRYNIRSNIDANITENLGVSVDFAYRSTILDKANFNVSKMYGSLGTAKPVFPYIHEEDPTKATYSGFNQRSPYYQTIKDYSGFREDKTNAVQGALELSYSFPMIKGLKARARLNYEEIFRWNKNVSKPFDVYEYDPVEAGLGKDPWINQGTQNTNNMYVYSDRANEILPLVSLEYDNTFGDHHVKGVIVGEKRKYNWTSLRGDRKDILSYEAPYLVYASEEGKDNSENMVANDNTKPGVTQKARSSIIGRVNYDYMGKYLFEFAMRADASAEYPKDGRWGYFPSMSAGWRISEEPFIKDNFTAINNLKLRASYGMLGNDAVSSFDYLTGYEIPGQFYIFGSTPVPVITSAGLANPDVTWETMTMYNVGLDGIFWEGKLGFEIDAFYRLREDILAQSTEQVPNTFGATMPRTNLNKSDNRGFEIVLSHKNKIGDFSYDISPMFSWARGKYVELQEEIMEITDDMDEETKEFNRLWNARYVNEGQWTDRTWGFVSDGFFMNRQEIDEHPVDQDQAGNQTLIVGDIKYKDLNGDDYIDWRDQKVIGNGSANDLPNIMYSLDMGAQYKGFGIRMLWQGAADYVATVSGRAAASFSNESVPIAEHYKYRAIVGTDADGNDYITNPDDFKLPPVTQNGRTANNATDSDFWTYNARFLRLKNLNISYTVPRKLIEDIGINQCVFYMSGTNLFSISNLGIWKKSFDPEETSHANNDYPPVKTLTFGLRLTL